jgi:hypothetical protein
MMPGERTLAMPLDFIFGLRVGLCLGALGLVVFLIARMKKGRP